MFAFVLALGLLWLYTICVFAINIRRIIARQYFFSQNRFQFMHWKLRAVLLESWHIFVGMGMSPLHCKNKFKKKNKSHPILAMFCQLKFAIEIIDCTSNECINDIETFKTEISTRRSLANPISISMLCRRIVVSKWLFCTPPTDQLSFAASVRTFASFLCSCCVLSFAFYTFLETSLSLILHRFGFSARIAR